jgi:hypothetical protein
MCPTQTIASRPITYHTEVPLIAVTYIMLFISNAHPSKYLLTTYLATLFYVLTFCVSKSRPTSRKASHWFTPAFRQKKNSP